MKQALILIFLLSGVVCFAQNSFFIVKVEVSDSTNNLPVKHATVFIPTIKKEFQTGKENYVRMGLPKGKYMAFVSAYEYNFQTVFLNINSDTTINVQLKPMYKSLTINEVVVHGNLLDKTKTVETSIERITPKAIKVMPALAGEEDIVKLLTTKAGVMSGSEGSADIMVRGGSTDQNLFILDGNTIYKPTHLFGFFSSVNSMGIEYADFYKAGFPARYGGKLSSVIDVKTREPNKDSLFLNAEIGVISAKALLEAPIVKNKTAMFLSARTTWIDKAYDLVTLFGSSHDNLGFYDTHIKIDHALNDSSNLTLNLYSDKDYWNIVYSENDELTTEWKNKFASLNYNSQLPHDFFLNVSGGISGYQMKMEENDESGDSTSIQTSVLKSSLCDLYAKMFITKAANNNIAYTGGIDFCHHNVLPIYSQETYYDTTYLGGVDAEQYNELAIYGFGVYSPLKNVTTQYGLRCSYAFGESENAFSIEPRLNAKYSLNEINSLKASVAKSSQTLHLLRNIGLGMPIDVYVPFSSEFKPETAWHYALSYSTKRKIRGQSFMITLEGYYKQMSDIISYKIGYSSDSFFGTNTVLPEDVMTNGRGYSYGAELTIEKPLGKINGWLAYTCSKTMEQFDDLNGGDWFYAKQHRPNNLSIVLNYDLNRKHRFSINFKYMTGERVTLPTYIYNRAIYDFMNDNVSARDYYMPFYAQSSLNAYKMRDFHKLDVAYSYRFKKKKWNGEWSFSIYNIYNRKNAFYYYLDYERDISAEDDENWYNATPRLKMVSMLPIIPSASLKIMFK